MRKSKEESAQTRERIVATAAAQFRKNGIGATGIADLMQAVGLTNGGFYRHFASKDQLIAEASAAALGQVNDLMAGAAQGETGSDALHKMAQLYLSTFHRDNPQLGCVFGTLGSELAHADERTRETATLGFLKMVDLLAAGATDEFAKQQAMVSLCTMIGALTISRLVTDEALSDSILKSAADAIIAVK